MKPISLVACCLLLSCATLQAGPHEPKGKAKITKNEAEHIALKGLPGGRVTAAKLETVKGMLVWSVQIVQEKSKPATQVEVDAMSGRILSSRGVKP